MDDVIAAVTAAMKELGEGVAQNVPRRRVFPPGGILNVMFASYPGGRCTGLKAYTVADGHARFLVTLFGLDGSLEALIEADFMGAYRTGAASAVAARALARPGPATVAMIGAGWQAATQALAISRVLEIKELRVFSRRDERRAEFAREQEAQLGCPTIAAGSAELAVRGADVVVTMTTSKTPVIEADWVEPHALVIAAGSNWHNKAEVPVELVAKAQTIVVCGRNAETRDRVLQMVGEHNENFKVFGYTGRMADLMKISDLFIGKPGGLTTAESLACGLPMVIVSPIPDVDARRSLAAEGSAGIKT